MTKKAYFNPVDTKVDFSKLEGKLVKHWKKKRVFEKSVNSRSKDKNWTFLDGPPFITGLPHYGSLLSSIAKDLYPRYWTMKGYRVRRVWGWDCHGLPAEHKVENKLGIKRKRDIEEKVGVKKFIEECKLYVNEVSEEWEWYVDHVGRWVDFKNSYKTMDKDYMESVMWVFKQIYDKGYIYKGLRVSLYCPRCSTPISNFEVAMDADNYKDITEPSNVYKYLLKDEDNTFVLAWSTTPWNKIVTPALAVNPKLVYVKVKQNNENYILTETTIDVLKGKYKILKKFKGSKLIGRKFEPHYSFYEVKAKEKAFEIVGADFVSAEEGTGVVTIAAYGEDDLVLMKKENITIALHVDDEGNLKDNVPNWAGKNYLEVNKLVNKDLAKRGLLYREDPHTHSVAHCWRCGTRLFYNPQNAWYIDAQKLKPLMKKTNMGVNWFPKHFKYGRFLKSMEAAPDWCISRSRYWGSPVPVWECECGDRYVPGSITELEKLSKTNIKDLHKPEIDDVTIKCKKCGKVAKRVPEVLDSWVEAGSAPFAERHYPFEKGLNLQEFFPPDFIIEYTGQIRAWFYVLHVISAAIFGSKAFKNVLVTGVILGDDGRKMSKNFGNYPDPRKMLKTYGGDALRLYLMNSPVMRGEDVLISEQEYRNQVKGLLLPLWNVYNFFVTYANLNNWRPSKKSVNKKQNVLDKWIIARLNKMVRGISNNLEQYDTPEVVSIVRTFLVDDLSNWYVRRSRDRVALNSEAEDKVEALQTLWAVLTTLLKVVAPIVPFISEVIYTNLTKEESVHLTNWPKVKSINKTQKKLIDDMSLLREVVEKAHSERKIKQIPVRQPLSSIKVLSPHKNLSNSLLQLLKDEINVKSVNWVKGKTLKVTLDTKITTELRQEAKARNLVRRIQKERRKLGVDLTDSVVVVSDWLPKNKTLQEMVARKTLAKSLLEGKSFKVKKAG